MGKCLKITDFENIQKIVSKNYFIFRPFKTFKRKLIKFCEKSKKLRLQKFSELRNKH